jgi:nitroreductase
MSLLDAVNRRRSQPIVTAEAPSHDELLPLVTAAACAADHGALTPWRLIELRGDARARLGAAFAEASGAEAGDATKIAAKPMRAPLLIAVVVAVQPNPKIADWEQEAGAAGVAHMLSLLLDDAGWGVMWRSGQLTRSQPVRVLHGLADNEQLLGWLYVGGRPEREKPGMRAVFPAGRYLSVL